MKPTFQTLCTSIAVLGASWTSIRAFIKRMRTPAPGWRPAYCGNIKTLLMHLCDMDDELCMWILRWTAYQLRNPGAKMTTGLIINGTHPGKRLFFEDILEQLFGIGARTIVADQLHDRFTSWAAAPTSLVIVHGTFEPRHTARMRAFITAQDVLVEQSGQAPKVRRNYLNFVFLCKSPDFLPDNGSRRFVVVETPPAWPHAFLQAVKAEIAAGGVDAFREYLMAGLDMGKFNESTLPLPAARGGRQAA